MPPPWGYRAEIRDWYAPAGGAALQQSAIRAEEAETMEARVRSMHTHRIFAREVPLLLALSFSVSCATLPAPTPTTTPAPPSITVLPFAGDAPLPMSGVARGRVFHDQNSDGVAQPAERGIAGALVSNGRDIATTDSEGRYEISVTDDSIVFIVKPRGWSSPIDEERISRFYYIHKPNGSPPGLEFPGMPPTGPLPDSIDFPLYENVEPDAFEVVVLGDPQPRDQRELDYLVHDVLEELIGVNAAFGVSLGDLVFDDLALFEPLNAAFARVGIPWHNVLGNHDMNYLAQSDRESDERFEAVYGPSTYAFEYGPVHFVVLDDVIFTGLGIDQNGERRPGYHGGVTEDQLAFLEAYLETLPDDELLVVMAHIPFTQSNYGRGENRERLLELLALHPRNVSLVSHSHLQRQAFIARASEPNGPEHHQMVIATACGSWWHGALDEVGIPHTTMRDGAPNGYWIFHFEGGDYSGRFKVARRSVGYQMNIWAPEVVAAGSAEATEILVNVFAGSERSTVEMRVGGSESWQVLEPALRKDPGYAALVERETTVATADWASSPPPAKTAHLWRGTLDPELPVGTHVVEVRTTDVFGQQGRARRFIRVAPAASESPELEAGG